MSTPRTLKVPRVFYGWWIVAAGLIIAILQGAFYVYGFGVLYVPLLKALGTTRAALGGVIGLSRVEGGLIAPIAGWLIDRYGPRRLLFLGLTVMGLGFLALSRITALWQLYAVFLFLAAGSSFGSLRPVQVSVANWFIRKRSRAFGFLLAGFSIGGSLGWALAWLIETFGWRTSAVIGGLSFWIIGFPMAWVVRHRPEQMGLLPDGVPPIAGRSPVASIDERPEEQGPRPPQEKEPLEVEFTPRQALRTRAFWMLAIAGGVWSAVVTVTTLYQIPFLKEELGASLVVAATIASIYSFVGIPGRIVFGWLGDLINIRLLLVGTYLIQVLGLVTLSLIPNLGWAPLYILLLAPAYGGSIPLRSAILAQYYGRRNFGTITGLLQVVDLPGAFAGPIFVGWVYDTFGSYRPGFQIIAFLLVIGALAVLLARRPKAPETAGAAGSESTTG